MPAAGLHEHSGISGSPPCSGGPGGFPMNSSISAAVRSVQGSTSGAGLDGVRDATAASASVAPSWVSAGGASLEQEPAIHALQATATKIHRAVALGVRFIVLLPS